jgi:16S rRNA (cytosine967-C5)-methyltransferase
MRQEPPPGSADLADRASLGGIDSVLGLRLSDALPMGMVGREVTALLARIEEQAPKLGYYAAMAEAARSLRQLRSLHSRARRFVGDALHNAVRLLRRLRHLASESAIPGTARGGPRRVGAEVLYAIWLFEQLVPAVTVESTGPAPLAAWLAQHGLSPSRLQAARLHLGARLARLVELAPDERIDALGEALSYPTWLVRRFVDAFGCEGPGLEQAVAILRAQNDRAPLCVRVNRLRATREAAAERLRGEGLLARPTKVASHGLYLDGHANVYATQSFAEGWIELQDEGSQLIAELCAPPPGGVVVDACAGAGGKTLALGALLESRGRLLSIDVDRRKLDELLRRARRAGLTNVQALAVPDTWTADGGASSLPAWLRTGLADRVLVDAPCSGLGVLRRNPEARWRLQAADLTELAATQLRLLHGSASLVRPHGRLIYSTCTVLPGENEDVVRAFLAQHPEFVPVPLKEIFGGQRAQACSDPDGLYLRTLPTPGGPDGFFAAVLRRAS